MKSTNQPQFFNRMYQDIGPINVIIASGINITVDIRNEINGIE